MGFSESGETGRAREERAGGGGEGRGGCPYLRRGCCHCGHLSEEVAAATLVARPPMKAGETQIRKKPSKKVRWVWSWIQ